MVNQRLPTSLSPLPGLSISGQALGTNLRLENLERQTNFRRDAYAAAH